MSAMDENTRIFEENRTHLRAVAYRLLGSVHEARALRRDGMLG